MPALPPRPTLASHSKASTRHQPRFHEPGARGFHPPAPLVFRARARVLPFGRRLAWNRMRPHPRVMRAHESFAPTRSARTPHVTTSLRHQLETAGRNDAAARTLALAKKRRLASPHTSRSRGPPAGSFSLSRLATGSTGGPTNRDGKLGRSTRADRPAPFGTVGCLGRLRSPATRAEGRFTRCSAKSREISRTRGAFHR
jgi:hypothetical protein